ncbi:uncharacterized protein PRCAT00005116001 [Priceomyces carsonii]|uniref:uncharacterized protein n=1 Tax=Priceomyces carsonii TaxID=28549 RepID=UPI002EDA9A8B|nr:unnamed protein product [Priceomyces carsonii]
MASMNEETNDIKLPRSSRFFNQADLPDLKTFQLMKNDKPISFNGQFTNINYSPYNLPQTKTKSNFPMDYFHMPSRISLADVPKEDDIPVYRLSEAEAKDPIKVIEGLQEEGREYGAVKIILPDTICGKFRASFQINSDLFCFQTNRLLNNSVSDELNNRLEFHRQLIRFHLMNSKQAYKSKEGSKSTKDTAQKVPGSDNTASNSPSLNIIENKVAKEPIDNSVEEASYIESENVNKSTQLLSSENLNGKELESRNLISPSTAADKSGTSVPGDTYGTQEPHLGAKSINDSDIHDANATLSSSQATIESHTLSRDVSETSMNHMDQVSNAFPKALEHQVLSSQDKPALLNTSEDKKIETYLTDDKYEKYFGNSSNKENTDRGNSSSPEKVIKPPDLTVPGVKSEGPIEEQVLLQDSTEVKNIQKDSFDTRSVNTVDPNKGPCLPPRDNPKPKMPSFLNKLPMIDKRPLDLYKLFRSVLIRGGFMEVISKKLWAQIGRELGYKGKIMTSLSSSLKSSYQRILYPFELHLGHKKFELAGLKYENDISKPYDKDHSEEGLLNENGKRPSENGDINSALKRHKTVPPLIIGSAKEFKRSLKVKSAKGFLLNSCHLIDVKQPNTFTVKQEDETKKRAKKMGEVIESPITPESQLNSALKTMFMNQGYYQDESRLKYNGKYASIYSLRQFMEKDIKFQEFLINHNSFYFNKMNSNNPGNYFAYHEGSSVTERNTIDFKKFEELYWKFISNNDFNGLFDGMELEDGTSIPNFINGSGFVRIGDDFVNYKQNLSNLGVNNAGSKGSPLSPNPSTNGNIESSIYNSREYISKLNEAALNPWNLHNLPILPNSLFGALSENDLNNKELISSRLNIGMTFSTSNWRCEDHFTQLCNYQFFGAVKKWYFIPELEFEKFEELVKEINLNHKERVNINNQDWKIEELVSYFKDNDIEYDTLMNSLESMINPTPEIRMKHLNSDFQNLIDFASSELNLNQEFLITPEMLRNRGIKYHSTSQRPGELIVKYPKTYSSVVSFGLNLSEESNVATKCWLKYALEGERWLSKQSVLPNFSIIRLVINLIQLYDSGKNIGFNSEIYSEIMKIYDTFYNTEIELRAKVRKLLSIKELILDEKSLADNDLISDDELVYAFPSKVVLTEVETNKSFVMALQSFLKNFESKSINFEKYKIELHSIYSDERLKTFSKILHNYSINYDDWMKHYEHLMNENSDLSLKVYKSLLAEGEKIYSAISSSSFLTRDHYSEDYETIKLNTFKSYIENLRFFIDDSNQFIEDCQVLLAIKHQQRIRSGSDFQKTNGLNLLVKLIKRIPSLNFSCSEIDQILEFRNEIENFDKACKNLISRQTKNFKEFDDLIDLGESFGIALPCLSFLIRLRDRLKWIEKLELLEKGVDPFSEKRELFSIEELRDYFEVGISVLGKNDIKLIEKVEEILGNSEDFNSKLTVFLNSETANMKNVRELNDFIVAFKENFYFISIDNYDHLLKLQANIDLIEWINNFKEDPERYSYQEVKQKENLIIESGLHFDTSILIGEMEKAEKWISKALNLVMGINLVTTISKPITKDDLNSRLTLNESLIEKIFKVMDKLAFSFSEADDYQKSSSYFTKFLKAGEPAQKFYCFCREYEFETMTECDKCKEWYHLHCIHEGGFPAPSISEEEIYICPVCKLVESNLYSDPFLSKNSSYTSLLALMDEASRLKVYPSNELEMFERLILKVSLAFETLKLRYDAQDIQQTDMKLDELMFMFRKFYGCGIGNEQLAADFLLEIRLLEKRQDLVSYTSRAITPPTPPVTNSSVEVPDTVTSQGMILTSLLSNTLTAPINNFATSPYIPTIAAAPQEQHDITQPSDLSETLQGDF